MRETLALKNDQMRPQNSFLQFPQKILFFPNMFLPWRYLISNLCLKKFYYLLFVQRSLFIKSLKTSGSVKPTLSARQNNTCVSTLIETRTYSKNFLHRGAMRNGKSQVDESFLRFIPNILVRWPHYVFNFYCN